jgi:hypothetical protein
MRHTDAEIEDAARRFREWVNDLGQHPEVIEITPQRRHQLHMSLGDRGKCDDNCTHEPYPPCPVCGEVG